MRMLLLLLSSWTVPEATTGAPAPLAFAAPVSDADLADSTGTGMAIGRLTGAAAQQTATTAQFVGLDRGIALDNWFADSTAQRIGNLAFAGR